MAAFGQTTARFRQLNHFIDQCPRHERETDVTKTRCQCKESEARQLPLVAQGIAEQLAPKSKIETRGLTHILSIWHLDLLGAHGRTSLVLDSPARSGPLPWESI